MPPPFEKVENGSQVVTLLRRDSSRKQLKVDPESTMMHPGVRMALVWTWFSWTDVLGSNTRFSSAPTWQSCAAGLGIMNGQAVA